MAPQFETHQMIHFARVLGEKWACPRPGHNICVPTEHGGHHELSDDDITGWVTALVSICFPFDICFCRLLWLLLPVLGVSF